MRKREQVWNVREVRRTRDERWGEDCFTTSSVKTRTGLAPLGPAFTVEAHWIIDLNAGPIRPQLPALPLGPTLSSPGSIHPQVTCSRKASQRAPPLGPTHMGPPHRAVLHTGHRGWVSRPHQSKGVDSASFTSSPQCLAHNEFSVTTNLN